MAQLSCKCELFKDLCYVKTTNNFLVTRLDIVVLSFTFNKQGVKLSYKSYIFGIVL